MIDALPLLLADDGYQISRSVRLRSSASAYFNRTPASAGNRRTWTWSGWVKRGALGASVALFSTPNGSADTSWFDIVLDANNKLNVSGFSTFWRVTTQVFRDPSAWYHVLVSVDTTQSTANNRIQVFVNGLQVSNFDTTNNMAQNADTGVNAAAVHYVGRSSASYFDGYLTEINFIDGQALTPSSFGETDVLTGVWKPKKYTGTYGTNGFFLNFSDPSAATAAAIGKDYSGNGNNWTPNNISVTSGATYDSMLDVPTPWADGGNGRGNYAVLNPLDSPSPSGIGQANLYWYSAVAAWQTTRATMAVSSGKWYWEVLCTNLIASSTYAMLGVDNFTVTITSGYPGASSGSYGYFSNDGNKFNNGATIAYGASYASNDIIGVAFDLDAGTLVFYKNGVSQGTAYTGISGTYVPAFGEYGSILQANFGQRPFSYTPPTGFKALNTLNLPEPTIKKGNLYFDATTYTGNGTSVSVVNSGAMQPDFVWIKARSTANQHNLIDSVRGTSVRLRTDDTTGDQATPGTFTLNSNGFTTNTSNASFNENGQTFVGWQWKEGATQGFDIVTYTGTGANRTVAHSLGVAPSMMIVKNRSVTDGWLIYHASIGNTNFLEFTTAASASSAAAWNNTSPTSSVFTVGTSSRCNGNGNNIVAYLFSEVAGFSRFGSYTGNGSTDGPFVFTGFRPRWVMIKNTGGVSSWYVYDSSRDTYNVMGNGLYPNLSSAESGTTIIDFLSNGFKIRTTATDLNTNGNSMIFAAFAENPFKNSLAR